MEKSRSREDTQGFSIIIPLYNKRATVARAIESVLCQGVEAEIVVVDDGSTDGSDEKIRSFGDKVRYIWQENAGPSAARNRGARLSRYPLLIFLDADDEFLPGCLTAHLACRKEKPEVKISISPSRALERTIAERGEDFTQRGAFHYSSRFLHEIVTGIPVDSICVDRDLFQAAGGFDVELRCWEVTDFLYRLVLASPAVGFLDRRYVVVHKNPDNSQFLKGNSSPKYRKLHAQKMIDRFDDLPCDQRKRLLENANGTVKALLMMGAREEAKELLKRIRVKCPSAKGVKGLSLLSLLPTPVMRTAASVRQKIACAVKRPPRRISDALSS